MLPDDLTLSTFDPADSEELRAAQNVAFADYPSYNDIDEVNWPVFMVTAAHVRNDQSFVLRDPARDNAVAAYVFTHEYAIAPSGEKGREAYVAYVGTLPDYRGRGLATNLLAHTLHAVQGGRLRHLEPRRRHRQPDGGARASTSAPATPCATARTTTSCVE